MTAWLLRIFLAGLVFLAVFLLYSPVTSHAVAIGIAAAIALAELAGSVAIGGSQRGAGSGLRLMFWLGAPVLAWPVAALGIEWLMPALSQPEAASGAAIAAALTGLSAAGHGSGMDSRRNVAVLLAALIPLYVLGRAVTSYPYDPLAIALACLAVAAAALVTRVVVVLPRDHEEMLTVTAAVCGLAAAVGAASVAVFHLIRS